MVKASGVVIAPHMEDLHQSFVCAGNRFVLEDAMKLAFVRPVFLELSPIDDLYRSRCAQRTARQPHLSISATAYTANERVIWNCGWSARGR
jgi:hypothetical protein